MVAVTSRSKQIDAQFLLFPHIANPRRDERLVGAVDAEADELVALDMCRSHDVDDGLRIRSIFGRGIGDGFDACDGIGGQGLEIGLQVLLSQFRGLVVDPNLHARHAAQRDVAFHVDLHAGRVLQCVLGGTRLDRWVFTDVVDHLLAFHGIERTFRRNGDLPQRGHARVET